MTKKSADKDGMIKPENMLAYIRQRHRELILKPRRDLGRILEEVREDELIEGENYDLNTMNETDYDIQDISEMIGER